ncbi:hypothetical protein IL306_015218, partial [Fusarium sp. DS 682]
HFTTFVNKQAYKTTKRINRTTNKMENRPSRPEEPYMSNDDTPIDDDFIMDVITIAYDWRQNTEREIRDFESAIGSYLDQMMLIYASQPADENANLNFYTLRARAISENWLDAVRENYEIVAFMAKTEANLYDNYKWWYDGHECLPVANHDGYHSSSPSVLEEYAENIFASGFENIHRFIAASELFIERCGFLKSLHDPESLPRLVIDRRVSATESSNTNGTNATEG